MTFYEKGEKVIDKPIPHAFLEIVHSAISVGVFPDEPDAYVVPMLRKQTRHGERDDRVIWRIIKDVGIRAGLPPERVFPHALRHAFSVRFLEQHPGEIEALQRVLGHSKIETTQRYWRAMEHNRLKERARDITWETRYESNREEATSGFEPLYEALQASA